MAGDSLPLSPEELELLEEVEKVKEKVEEKVSVKQEKMDDFAKMVFGRETRRPPKQWSE